MMERFVRHTPSMRPALLRRLRRRTLTGISVCFSRNSGGESGLLREADAFGHANGLLTLSFDGFVVDVTGLAAVRSMLLRMANPEGFRWAEYAPIWRPESLALTAGSHSDRLASAIGKRITGIRILRTRFGHLAYQGRPSDAGLELELDDGQRLLVSQLLTRTPGVLTVSTPDAIDPEIAPHIDAVDIDSVAVPAPLSLPVVDPFDGAASSALREGRAILSASLADYDIFDDDVVSLESRFDGSPAQVAALGAIRSALIQQNCSVTDIRFYLGADGTVALAEPLDVVEGTAPAIDVKFIDVLTDAIAGGAPHGIAERPHT